MIDAGLRYPQDGHIGFTKMSLGRTLRLNKAHSTAILRKNTVTMDLRYPFVVLTWHSCRYLSVPSCMSVKASRCYHHAHKAALCRAPSTISRTGRSIPPNGTISLVAGLLFFNSPLPGDAIKVTNVIKELGVLMSLLTLHPL